MFKCFQKELAENQAIISKERDENKKITIENFEKKLKTRAKLVEKENKSIRESQFLQKVPLIWIIPL